LGSSNFVFTIPFRNVYSEYREVKEADNSTAENLDLPSKMSADSVLRISLAVRLALECHRTSLVYSQNNLLDGMHLLPDTWIDLAASKHLSIRTVEDLKTLSRKIPLGQSNAIGDGLLQALVVISGHCFRSRYTSIWYLDIRYGIWYSTGEAIV